MKKISCVYIFASPHKNGNCAKIGECFRKALDFEYDQIEFNAYDICAKPCVDCGYCKTQEKCAFRDLDELYSAIEECELLVIVSPAYNMSFPAPMKAILDRFQRYYNARFTLGVRPALRKHRKAVLLAAAGSDKETGETMINQLKQSFSVMNTDLCAWAVINGLDNDSFDEDDSRILGCAKVLNNIISTSSH